MTPDMWASFEQQVIDRIEHDYSLKEVVDFIEEYISESSREVEC